MAWPEEFREWTTRGYLIVNARVYRKLVRRGIRRQRAVDLADEGIQEAFARAAEKKDTPEYFQGEVHFLRWLVVVAYRYVLDKLPREGRYKPLGCDDFAHEEASADAREARSEALGACLKKLSQQQRRILLLHDFHRLTDQEIALCEFSSNEGSLEALGLRIFRLRRHGWAALRSCLLEQGLDPETWEIDPERKHPFQPPMGKKTGQVAASLPAPKASREDTEEGP